MREVLLQAAHCYCCIINPMGLVLVGRKKMQIVIPYFIELLIFTVHFLLTFYLEHVIFNLLQLAKCEYMNCSENESESKKLRLQQ